ncbi:low molecular weight protein-tyrosine-phosphatase [Paenibacillus sp. LHD-117]|uniref:low molecular weight protein-tyrosine-phosphatase n=1 Tax=Paenibacillus sp. LHD-117 TaxID=3071412 RepID=UPI0027E0CAB4|nr:low molecular weight protein-tyrosine-phosphatase [Paenibacillus sp. LHD-117]MDQ6418074.1 low molecular weight protein-tyrosine-phosphatase [Paenibacillus sp. LHD-117]
MSAKASVLFVCLGNICRSPMAEAVMRHLVRQEGLSDRIEIDSAGTGDWHLGHPPHEGTRGVLDRHGIRYDGMKARLVNGADFDRFTYIVCMDSKNLKDASEVFGEGSNERSKLFTFMELLPERGIADVPDPYYSGNFDHVYELVEAGCKVLLQKVKEEL